nr:hypothetical protein BgiMline_009019 [Biomphalaria glabrata]
MSSIELCKASDGYQAMIRFRQTSELQNTKMLSIELCKASDGYQVMALKRHLGMESSVSTHLFDHCNNNFDMFKVNRNRK